MDEINFLFKNNKDGGRKAKSKKDNNDIEWSEPDKEYEIKNNESSKKHFWRFLFRKKEYAGEQSEKISADLNRSRNKILNSTREQPITEKSKKISPNNTKEILKIKKGGKEKIKQKQEEQEWENPDIIETNLIKNEIISFFDWQKGTISLVIACILPCLIIAVIYGFLFSWEKKMNYKNQGIVDKINEADMQVKGLEVNVKDILFFQKKLKLAEQLLGSHIYWTNFFKFLENYTLADVFYDGFAGDISGNYSLNANAKDFWTIAQQIKTMRTNDNVLRVNVGGGRSSSGGREDNSGVNFKLELSVDPKIFVE